MTSKTNGAELEIECCMCGDFGFSNELFHCKICQFRSQHRYCSNLYPKSDCHLICNWCLKESKPKSPNCSSSIKKTRILNIAPHKDQIRSFESQEINRPIKKQRLPEFSEPPPPPPPPARRTALAGEDKIRRTRSEEISHRSGTQRRQVVFRNKVRRYKLLDEVTS